MKARSDAYTGMLLISFLAMLVGGTLLFLDYRAYPTGTPPVANVRPSLSP